MALPVGDAARLQGRPLRLWSEVLTRFGELLPPYPGVEAVPVARLPEPPRLAKDWTRPFAAVRVVLGYRCAVGHEYGSCRAFSEVDPKHPRTVLGSKHYPVIEGSIDTMVEYQVSPVSWTSFSIFVWRKYVVGGAGAAWDSIPSQRRAPARSMPPPPGWVFSAKRLRERTDWFAWHEERFVGGRLILTKAHKSLIAAYGAMRTDLVQVKVLDEAAVRAVVHHRMPKKWRTAMIAEATEKAEFHQARLNRAAKNGEWIW